MGSGWVAVPSPSGFDLTFNRHPVGYDLDLEEIIQVVRRRGGTSVKVEDPTGYQETIRVPR